MAQVTQKKKKRRLKEINVLACLPNYLLNKFHKPRVITLFLYYVLCDSLKNHKLLTSPFDPNE